MSFEHIGFVGFYITKLVNDEKTLHIGPFQGHVFATGIIPYGKGVCGTAAEQATTQIVADVSACDNYIACDNETKSEIVVPVFGPAAADGARDVVAVLDVDSGVVGGFDEVDRRELEALCADFLY
mmetsp:Transcript_20300/g.56222  ORF Transcript_20300/g.56222 Transcript_20300/m.56222 type:complete len:125 (-) Transcript_20300:29-403(-)